MRILGITLCTACVAVLSAARVGADNTYPTLERGFSPEKAYQIGEVAMRSVKRSSRNAFERLPSSAGMARAGTARADVWVAVGITARLRLPPD